MKSNNILSVLWESIEKYDVIDEALLAENTFIQQTSRGENLWKAQLGMTKNFIIFLRCDVPLVLENNNNDSPPEQINILLNIVPMSHLKVEKYGRRTLEILFPSGSVCYFKLPMHNGCGKAWKRWRALEELCDADILSVAPKSILISFPKLNRKIQKIILSNQFDKLFIDFKKFSQKVVDSVLKVETNDQIKSLTTADKEEKDDNLQALHDLNMDVKQEGKSHDTEILDEEREVLEKNSFNGKDKKKRRKTRQIRRFGEGVPENCMFDLTLSYSDELVEINGCKVDTKIETDKEELYEPISLEERALRMFGRSFTDSSETQEKNARTNISGRKHQNKSHYKSHCKICESKEDNNRNKMKKILNTAQFFTNMSLLFIVDDFRASKSVESAREIPATKCDRIFITRNLSLPNINELSFYRRFNRLNYCLEYFENNDTVKKRNHFIHPVSFWMPEKNLSGRIYCTASICRKISAEKIYTERQNDHLGQETGVTENVLSEYVYNFEAKPKKSHLIKENGKENPHLPINITSDLSQVLKVSSSQEEMVQTEKTVRWKDVKVETSNKLDLLALKPFTVAYELQLIQQRMFGEIETSELLRFILKPHTVTEIALACFRRRDEQSAYAIMSGICSPKIIIKMKLMTYVMKQPEIMKNLMHLFKVFHKRRKFPITHKKIPFFLDFISVVAENIIKAHKPATLPERKHSIWNYLLSYFQKAECNGRSERILSELIALNYQQHESVLNIIEETRKYFTLEDYQTVDSFTRHYLLYKQF